MEKSLKQLTVDNPNVRVERYVTEGMPAEAIVRAAEETNCDLIVMATHGRTGAKRVVLGSVAETVMRRSRCPDLIVKTVKNVDSESDQAPHEFNVRLPAWEV
jgi:universal stress protein A